MDPPFDFAIHDGAHDYNRVKKDLKMILPMMRKFGLVCVHDTQHEKLGKEMLYAIEDAVKNHKVSFTHIPFMYGLTIIRMEDSCYDHVPSPWKRNNYSYKTQCFSIPMQITASKLRSSDRINNYLLCCLKLYFNASSPAKQQYSLHKSI